MDGRGQKPTPMDQLSGKPSQAEGDIGDDDITREEAENLPADPHNGSDAPGGGR